MNLKNLKIETQLKFGFAVMFVFVVIIGGVSYYQTDKIDEQIDLLYNHPLTVRRAISQMYVDILKSNIATRTNHQHNEEERLRREQYLALSKANGLVQFDVLKSRYLGNPIDVKQAYLAFDKWHHAIELFNPDLDLNKDRDLVTSSSDHNMEILSSELLTKMKILDDFAQSKGDELYFTSSKLNHTLNHQIVIFVSFVFILSFLLMYVLLRNIREPFKLLIKSNQDFSNGAYHARCLYVSKNEYGILAKSFNQLADSIEISNHINENSAKLASIMLSENEAKPFMQQLLSSLANFTDSQMASVYLLSDDEQQFKLFESLGLNDEAPTFFSAIKPQGEFAKVLNTYEIHHLKEVAQSSKMCFKTVSGAFMPSEILTIPIISSKKVVAIISLAALKAYSQQALRFIRVNWLPISVRIEGVLAFQTIKQFLANIELQNSELEIQKKELTSLTSELRVQNSELDVQKKELQVANHLKTSFLSNMSHELRTPLNSVIALSGVLNRKLKDKIPADEYGYLDVIERNGKNLLALINDILDISRIEAGKEELDITEFNMVDLVTDLADMIEPQAKLKGVELNVKTSKQQLNLTSDEKKCRHILQNIISNAVKFTDVGEVLVSIEASGNVCEIIVKDSGIGIAEQHLPFIFDEFRQADGTTSRRFGGTGLGLAIAKKYVELLGGVISVVSTPGSGSRFTLKLPLSYSSDMELTATSNTNKSSTLPQSLTQAKPHVPSDFTLLLVEDSEPAMVQLNDFLDELGYNTILAHDGAEALAVISKTIPDAMIIDLMMPDVDGFQLLQELRNADVTATIPVLILTAKHITGEELSLLKRNNIHQIIQKGDVNRIQLLKAVASMLTRLPQVGNKLPLVLVVEDNQDNMLTLRALLNDRFRLIEATDGQNAVALAKSQLPDLILMDINLPILGGIEAFKLIRQNPSTSHIPVIALTASALDWNKNFVLTHGFEGFLSKPIEEELLNTTINDLLYGK